MHLREQPNTRTSTPPRAAEDAGDGDTAAAGSEDAGDGDATAAAGSEKWRSHCYADCHCGEDVGDGRLCVCV